MTLSDRLTFLIEYLDLAEATGDPDARWERYQLAHLNNPSLLAIAIKSRQIGWSWTAAAEAVAKGILTPRDTSIFTSINLDEAKEKVRYAKAIIRGLDREVRPRLIVDNQQEIEFENGSRIISHPSKPVRGRKATIYPDEFAHYRQDREIYTSMLPAITKGGVIRIGSSPLGAGGMLWEIFTESMKLYPGYARTKIPWWEVFSLCKDPETARKEAPEMETGERVYKFGKPRLVTIFENMLLEDFQQEYECAWVDESVAWIPWEIIKDNQQDDLLHWHAKSVDEALNLIPVLQRAVADAKIEQVLAGGIDIGRKRNLTEMIAVGKATVRSLPVRLMVSLDRVPYDDQERCFREIITQLPFTQVLIDSNGIGAQLAENLERTGRAEGATFTNATKELWAVEARIQMERKNVPIPPDRELAYQIHSIKKKVTAAKNNVFDTERNEKHHADKWWSLALAIWAAKAPSRRLQRGRSPTEGYRG